VEDSKMKEELREAPVNGVLATLQMVALAVLMLIALGIFFAAAITTIIR
jgi:hypothetical protein